MLKFDSKGFLKPCEPIPCTVSELKTQLVDGFDSVTRQINYDNYIRYSDQLKALLGGIKFKQWINGSFVTKKENPKDIDLVTFISHAEIKKLGHKLDIFRPEGSWLIYGVDAYIIEVHPAASRSYTYFTEWDIAYWLNLFAQTRPNRRGQKQAKGFLEIIY